MIALALCAAMLGLDVECGPAAQFLKYRPKLGKLDLKVDPRLSSEPLIVADLGGGDESFWRAASTALKADFRTAERDQSVSMVPRTDPNDPFQNPDARARALKPWFDSLAAGASTPEDQAAALLAYKSGYQARIQDGSLIKDGVLKADVPDPLQTLLKRCLRNVSLQELAKVTFPGTASWCSRPQGRAWPFPAKCAADVQDYVRAMALISPALQADDIQAPYRSPWANLLDATRADASKGVFLLTCIARSDGLLARMRYYSETGMLVSEAAVIARMESPVGTQLSVELDDSISRALRARTLQPLEETAKDFLVNVRAGQDAQEFRPSKHVRASDPLRFPTRFEPTSLGFRQLIGAVSKAIGRPVMTCLPDSTFGLWSTCVRGDKLDLSALWKLLRSRPDLDFIEAEEWLVITSHSTAQARFLRLNRNALEDFTKSVLTENEASLLTESVFCQEAGLGAVTGELQAAWRLSLLRFGLAYPFPPLPYVVASRLATARRQELAQGLELPTTGKQGNYARSWLETGGGKGTGGKLYQEPSLAQAPLVLRCESKEGGVELWNPGDGLGSNRLFTRRMPLSLVASVLRQDGVTKDNFTELLRGRYHLRRVEDLRLIGLVGDAPWTVSTFRGVLQGSGNGVTATPLTGADPSLLDELRKALGRSEHDPDGPALADVLILKREIGRH